MLFYKASAIVEAVLFKSTYYHLAVSDETFTNTNLTLSNLTL